jgi:predicted MFS family arabinose efflux permease
LAWAAKYLVRAFHVGQGSVGHYLWLPPLIFDVTTILFGDLASRQKRAPGAPPRLLFAIGVVLSMTIAFVPFAQTPWQAAVVLGFAMAGGGVVYTMITIDLLSRVAHDQISFAAGSVASAQSLALIVTSPLIGWSVDRFHSFDVACVGLALWCLPGAVYWLLKKQV